MIATEPKLLHKMGASELVRMANEKYDERAILSRETRMRPNFT